MILDDTLASRGYFPHHNPCSGPHQVTLVDYAVVVLRNC